MPVGGVGLEYAESLEFEVECLCDAARCEHPDDCTHNREIEDTMWKRCQYRQRRGPLEYLSNKRSGMYEPLAWPAMTF